MNDNSSPRQKKYALAIAAAATVVALSAYFAMPGFDRQADDEEIGEMAGQVQTNMELMQETLSLKIDERQLVEEKQRMESETGLVLSARCAEWTEFHSNHPDESSKRYRDEACRKYNDYVLGAEEEGQTP